MKAININDKIQNLAISVRDNSETKDQDLNELCILLMPKLEYFIWRFFKDEHTIKDVVSTTLEKMIKKIHMFNPSYRFTTWIYRIATNEALSVINKNKANAEVEITSDISTSTNPNYGLESFESNFDKLHILTIEAIHSMPDDINKQIIIEKHINDLKGSDIANKFGINENTVKTKLRAMRKKIRDYVEDKDKVLFNKTGTILYDRT